MGPALLANLFRTVRIFTAGPGTGGVIYGVLVDVSPIPPIGPNQIATVITPYLIVERIAIDQVTSFQVVA